MKKYKILTKCNKAVLSFSYGNYNERNGGTDKVIKAHKEMFIKKDISYIFLSPKVFKVETQCPILHLWELIIDDQRYGVVDTARIIDYLEYLCNEKEVRLIGIQIHHIFKAYIPDLSILLKLRT